jgi:hypothetical protein
VPAPALNDGHSKHKIAARPLDPPLVRTLGLIQRRDKPDDPALRAVRNMLLTLVDGSVGGEESSEPLPEIPRARESPDRDRPKHPRPGAAQRKRAPT